jgi:hypothetical protein
MTARVLNRIRILTYPPCFLTPPVTEVTERQVRPAAGADVVRGRSKSAANERHKSHMADISMASVAPRAVNV